MATVGCGVKYHLHTNNNNRHKSNKNKRRLLVNLLAFTVWTFLTLTNNYNIAVQSAAVYSNVDFLSNPIFEPLCALQQERFIESEGKESSLLLEFNSKDVNEKSTKSCRRILSAPSAYGFIVRLILPKIRHHHHHHQQQYRIQPQQQRHKQQQQHQMVVKTLVGGHAVDVPLSGSKISSKNKMAAAAALSEMTSLIEQLNGTAKQQLKTLTAPLGRTCPLSVFSSLDPHTPQWRVDPCQLEDMAPEMEDPVRLFHGRLRIVWEHGHQELDSKLMVTVLGKGDECRSETKHQCLKIGDEPILCISKDLICDGIRHCPNSNEYDSDEDYAMCWQRRRFGEPMPVVGSEIFEHFALEVFRNLFAFDVPGAVAKTGTKTEATTTTPATAKSADDVGAAATSSGSVAKSTTTLRKVNTKQMTDENSSDKEANETGKGEEKGDGDGSSDGDGDGDGDIDSDASNSTAAEGTHNSLDNNAGSQRRNSTRLGLNSDLSKYGPWGYLMLGMLLCGGALLICGLWASATQHAANNERESNLQHSSAAANSSISNEHTSNGAPPNYEELDPPPSYAALFPNQKAASSTTLNSMGNTTATALAVATVAATATAIASVPSEGVNRRTAPLTQAQLESQASGSSASNRATS